MKEQKNLKYLIVAVVLASSAAGYFAGREHVKYEIKQSISEVSNQFKKEMSGIFAGKNADRNYSPQNSGKSDAKTLNVSLTKKGYRDFNMDIGSKAITFLIEITNTLGKDIRAFDGVLIFSDILDNPIKKLNFSYTKPIVANETVSWEGEMEYNQFINSDRNLLSKEISDLKTDFQLRKVLYEDGTKEEF